MGKNETGQQECVQIKRREEGLGLGKKETKNRFKWDDQFWVNMYDNVAKKLNTEFPVKEENDTTSESNEEVDKKKQKKKGKLETLFTQKLYICQVECDLTS